MSATLVPAVELLARLGDPSPLQLGRPTGDDWWTLADATAQFDTWYPDVVAREGDRRAAASYLAGWLADVPILVVGMFAVLGDVAPHAGPDRLWLHRHPDGWLDRYAVDPVEVHRGPLDDVLAVAGAHVAELTAPVVEAACAALPIGPAAVWGAVADALGGYALHYARLLGIDEVETWRRCETLVDAVQARAPRLRTRPQLLPVVWSGGTAHYPVRGTCCLYYRTCDAPDRNGAGYCATCPLRTDTSRVRQLRDHLEGSAV